MSSSINDVLAELRKTYLAAIPDRTKLIESLWKEKRYSDVETEFHKLKGTGKTYGLPEISQIGEVAERLVENSTSLADQSVPPALLILQKIHAARCQEQVLVLERDPDFIFLSELVRRIRVEKY